MDNSSANAEQTFESLVDKMASLKVEHRPILEQIASDAGMSPETRRLLVSHVLDEEDEAVRAMQGTRAPSATSETSSAIRGLTVGSLK